MKLPAKFVAWMLPLMLSGCFLHKTPKAPPLVLSPDLGASKLPPPGQLPPPEVSIPTKPQINATNLPEQTAKPPVRRRRPATTTETETTDTPQAAAPPEVSAIGQLSSGDPSDLRQKTASSLYTTERGLNTVNRRLNDQEQKTAEHIREFIKQAKAALASGDVDGASTLAAKAKVLLSELQR
jgi:hypothetical protein